MHSCIRAYFAICQPVCYRPWIIYFLKRCMILKILRVFYVHCWPQTLGFLWPSNERKLDKVQLMVQTFFNFKGGSISKGGVHGNGRS